MDASRFDAWTRRRFSLLAGGALAATLGLGEAARVAAKKKKRCKKLGKACKPKKKNCCGNLACKTNPDLGGNRCCRKNGGACTEAQDCCTNACNGDTCFCKELGNGCDDNLQCCSRICLDFACRSEVCAEIGDPCTSNPECCLGVCDIGLTNTCLLPG